MRDLISKAEGMRESKKVKKHCSKWCDDVGMYEHEGRGEGASAGSEVLNGCC